MKTFLKDGYKRKKGQPPGTLLHIGEQTDAVVSLSSIKYNQDNFNEEKDIFLDSLKLDDDGFIKWYDIIGVHNLL